MKLFELYAAEPLDGPPGLQYGGVAAGGEGFVFLDQAAAKAAMYDRCLCLVEEYETARPYTGICYDATDRCYWACSSKDSAVIYKLNHRLAEVDRFTCRDYESCHGWIRGIAHNPVNDTLCVTYSAMVAEVDKETHCQRMVTHQEPCVTYKACLPCCGYTFCASVRCCMEHLTITQGSRLYIHTCLPAEYRFLSMAGACCEGRPCVYILALKHNRYYYILRGTMAGPTGDSTPAADCCGAPCGQGTEADSDHRDCPRRDCARPCCHEGHHHHGNGHHCGCHHWHDRDHDHEGSGEGTAGEGASGGNRGDSAEEIDRGYAEIVQSIALEQTAISHILNAEGEKIQRVVAEAGATADLLDVNESVMEMVQRLTHLEQVLCAKLEAATKVLRGR